jgi:hypothetical protein
VLFEAVLAELPPRQDRDLDAPLFPGFKGSNLRTSITRACKSDRDAALLPAWAAQAPRLAALEAGLPLAEIAERLGDTKVVTAEHYLFALGDYAEVDYRAAFDR